ncbi:hypothetical protein ABEB36_005845 [Hypothenemus hampei]|uniref:F-box only protein 9 n=1 Tax=Hypothenemus hampei TaxID=57062 RepID=A0ABD1EZK6_HYPHA
MEDFNSDEQDEPASSSHQISVENELNSFRVKWQQEIKSHCHTKIKQKQPLTSEFFDDQNDSTEEIARDFFLQGINYEKSGKLYEAIQFYRKAVQLVPDIEYKLDYRSRLNDVQNDEPNFDPTQHFDESNLSDDDNDELIEDGQLFARIQKKVSKSGYLCTSKFDQNFTHISSLPLELLLYILKWVVSSDLDLRSLEMFGSVCRGFYLCSRDPDIWKLTCLRIWGLNCGLPKEYTSWRNMFVERPRLNFNGCYISKTTYIRHGENSFQDQFYRPWHLVAYYRYLRFFPEGIVLMLTSSEDPTQCVTLMKSRYPRPPVMVGYYRLNGDKVTLVVQRQESAKTIQNTNRKVGRRREIDNSEQTFHMELKIENHKNRRHVKLVWEYYSVLTRTKQGHESRTNFDLIANRFPSLWFSRVKSFTSESIHPLS